MTYVKPTLTEIRGGPRLLDEVVYDMSENLDPRVAALEGGTVVTTDRYEYIRLPADAAASDVWERAVFKARAGLTIKSAFIIPDTGIGQATNYMTLDLQNKDTSGIGTTSLGSRAINSSNTLGAMVGADLVSSNATLTANQVVSLKKTVASAGQAFPGGLLVIKYALT
jgi:hypothetical protein